MPELSDLDRRIVAALQLDGRSSWSDIAKLAGTTESTASRRGSRLLDDGTVHVVGVTDPLVCGLGQPVLVQLDCAPDSVRSVVDTLAERTDTRFLTITTGDWDVVTELIVPSQHQLVTTLTDELGALPGVHRSSSALITKNFTMRHDWSRALLGDVDYPPEPCTTDTPTEVELDDVDRRLLAVLAEDGRRPYRDIAKTLTLGETGVRRRVERLVATHALVFSTLVSPTTLGFRTELLLWLRVAADSLDEVARLVAARPEVRYVSATAGSADLVCEVILPQPAEIYTFTTRVLGALPGIRSIDVALELENHKRAYRPFTLE
ncbi:Lrp/AsnC family transcriptional regulator [Prauserella alba]|uniref:Lrp/AsnC family transcriptional regulator n=1 Tax=Prauserella alba TaxID=176898 RepID=A0ABN1V6S9_9PSEU|nr:Lrp/AsnC family transcriptional regulator [Prauserella alba]MCP2181205.1 DNA-binding transcriptional regulator, Lrp family [Prauserella alba]